MATGGGGGSLGPATLLFDPPLLLLLPRDPNKFERILTECGVAFLNGSPRPPLLLPLLPLLLVLHAELVSEGAGLGWTLGGGGLGGGTLRDGCASKGESSQFVVGVYLWGFPVVVTFWGGGGAGAGLAGTADDDADLYICEERGRESVSESSEAVKIKTKALIIELRSLPKTKIISIL